MFHIKICGVRLPHEVDAVANSPADAVGFNFYPPSVRYLDPTDPATAKLSKQAAESGLIRVGVFVNESAAAITEVANRVELDQLQLHGDEPVEFARELVAAGWNVIRAIKLPLCSTGSYPIADRVTKWLDAGCTLMLDADAGASHGGSGQTLDWASIRQWSDDYPDVDWVLAGGLTVQNVARAIATSGARGVDVASGVEEPRGKKSSLLIEQFARLASEAMR